MFTGISQNIIRGTVTDVVRNQPLAGASVFVNSSSKGTVTDSRGSFELADLPPGKQEIIVSYVGYETIRYAYATEQLPLRVRFEMTQKTNELETVTLEPSVLEGWDKWGTLFLESFVGRTPNAQRCRIRNEKAIRFRYFKNSNRVIAWCDEPIQIENKALGYTISYQLENFEYNFSSRVIRYSGYPFFRDHAEGKKGKHRWTKDREQAYYGSMNQFMRSVFSNTLGADGFEVKRMVRKPNLEKQRVKRLYADVSRRAYKQTLTITDIRKAERDTTGSVDSLAYYDAVLRQQDYTDHYGSHLLTSDSLVIRSAGDYKAIYFPDYLYVLYRKAREDPAYLQQFGERRAPYYQGSQIWLPNDQPITIDAKGSYSPPEELMSTSYWGWKEKMAETLPIDYEPGR